VHALGARVGPQEEAAGRAADRGRLQRVTRVVGAGGQRGAHAQHLGDDHEEVPVREGGDEHQQAGRPQRLECPQHRGERRRRVEQDGAHGPDRGLRGDSGQDGQPGLGDLQRPDVVGGSARAHEGHERGDEEHERKDHARAPPDLSGRHASQRGHRRERQRAQGPHRPCRERSRDRHDGDPEEADELRARIERVDRAARVAGGAGDRGRVGREAAHRAGRLRGGRRMVTRASP
jgi:hypothetical protein